MDASLQSRAKQLANEFASQATSADDLNVLMRVMVKAALERMLNTEMDVHLGRRILPLSAETQVSATGLVDQASPGSPSAVKNKPNRRNGRSSKTVAVADESGRNSFFGIAGNESRSRFLVQRRPFRASGSVCRRPRQRAGDSLCDFFRTRQRSARGKAILRLAICGAGARTIEVVVNDQNAGQFERLIGDGAIARHSIQGLWQDREVVFDASLLKQGANVLKLVVPAGPINNGIIYDYVRLELDEAAG